MAEEILKKKISDKRVNIKQLIDDGYVIVCDTNVFLGLYRFSPDYANFAVECLNAVKESIILPYTVKIEFERHNSVLYKKRKEAVENCAADIMKLVENQKGKILGSFSNLVRRQFPEVDTVQKEIENKYNEICDLLIEYFADRSVLTLLQDSWDSDIVKCMFDELLTQGQIMKDFSRDEIYSICEEGVKRYKDNTPPGYKDAKEKDGIRKYSDLILWKEVIKYAHDHQKNVIFVTDDVKADWWNSVDGQYEFLDELVNEFKKKSKLREHENKGITGPELEIVPFVSIDFYESISSNLGIEKSDAVDQALAITDADYIESIEEDVFDSVTTDLMYSGVTYVDTASLTDIGSEGIEEWEIECVDFVGYEMIERRNDTIEYNLIYEVEMSGQSFDYWGKDIDTKEWILSSPYQHAVKGLVTVRVVRSVNIFMDFESSAEFDVAEILQADFEEISFTSAYVAEEDDCISGAYNICPDCGKAINFENDGGNGFCIECAPDH